MNGGLLDKIINEQLNNLITEEMGIADEVNDVSNRIIEFVKANFNRNIKFAEEIRKNVYGFKGSTTIPELFSLGRFKVVYGAFDFRGGKSVDIKTSAELSLKKHTISLIITSVDGKIDNSSLYGAVYHEVEHAYQSSMSENGLMKNNELYYKALELSKGLRGDNRFKDICSTIYASTNEEMDAFSNSLYGEIMSSKLYDDYRVILETSMAYKILKRMRNCRDDVYKNINNPVYIEILSKLGLKPNNYVNLMDRTIRNFSKKIGKVLAKGQKDRIELAKKNGEML